MQLLSQPRDSQAYATLDGTKVTLGQRSCSGWSFPATTKVTSPESLTPFCRLSTPRFPIKPSPASPCPTRFGPAPIFNQRIGAGRCSDSPPRAVRCAQPLFLWFLFFFAWPTAFGVPASAPPRSSETVRRTQIRFARGYSKCLAAREPQNFSTPSASCILRPTRRQLRSAQLDSQLPRDGVWLSGWELLGGTVCNCQKKSQETVVADGQPYFAFTLAGLPAVHRNLPQLSHPVSSGFVCFVKTATGNGIVNPWRCR